MNYLVNGLIYLITVFLILSVAVNAQDWEEFSVGVEPPTLDNGHTEVEFADVNNDGNIDMISIGDYGSPYNGTDQHGIMVWFGDGTGAWSVSMVGDFGYGGIAAGDVNNDGFIDVGYSMHHNYSQTDFGDQLIEAALGDGTGLNWTPYDDGLATAGENYGMFGTDMRDMNADGYLDIVSISFGSGYGLQVYKNNGDGSWTHSWGFLGGHSNLYAEFGDLNNDGFADIASCNQARGVYLNDRFGNFYPVIGGGITPPEYLGYEDIAMGDIDNDGTDELGIVAPRWRMEVWKLNEDEQTWTDMTFNLDEKADMASIDFADMNGDGYIDVVGFGRGRVFIYLGDGGNSWTLADSMTTPPLGISKALRAGADVDHNGFGDVVVVSNENDSLSAYNVMHFYKETSVPTELTITPEYPHGNEFLIAGSAITVEWKSAVPEGDTTTADIEFSETGAEGPYIYLAQDVPNNGLHQILLPEDVSSDSCFLRLTVRGQSGDVQAITPEAFEVSTPELPPYVSVDMIPENYPIEVPQGGNFTYTGVLINNTAAEQTVDVWVMLDVPGVGIYGPVQRANNITLSSFQTLSISPVRQRIPNNAPLGEYDYIAYCGDYPSDKMDSASFQFTVVSGMSTDNSQDDWELNGWFEDEDKPIGSSTFELSSYPNPFNATTTISFYLENTAAAPVKLEIFNLLGQRVTTLVDADINGGQHDIRWDASSMTSGLYLCKLKVGNEAVVLRLNLIK